MKNTPLDLSVEDHGSIILVRPGTPAGRKWLRDTAPEDAQFMCGALVVECRFLPGVLDAAASDGLSCSLFR